jgi:hypothetical protein
VLAAAACTAGRGETPGEARLAVGPAPGVSTWTNVTPPPPSLPATTATSPSGRVDAAMAFDPVRRKAVLYGGLSQFALGPNDDTWEWDSDTRTWASITVSAKPPHLRSHRMAYFDGSVVLFGGLRGTGAANTDLYKYVPAGNGTSATWTKVTPPGDAAPKGRWSHGLAVTGGGLVVEGGIDTNASSIPFDDTWVLPTLSSGWSDQSGTGAQRPGTRYEHAMFWDEGAAGLVLFGGTLVVDGGDAGVSSDAASDTWTGVSAGQIIDWSLQGSGNPGARTDSAAVWYPTFASAFLFSDGSATDTWRYSGGAWALDSPSGHPGARTGAAMTFDTARKVVLLFGGAPTSQDDTWEYHVDALPVVTAPTTASGTEAQLVTFGVAASDSVDSSETIGLKLFSISPGLPSGQGTDAVFTPVSHVGAVEGSVSFTPGCMDHGSYKLIFQATDGVNTVNASTTLTIADADCPPVFAPITPPVFQVGQPGSFVVNATDPDGDTISYAMDAVTSPRVPNGTPSFDGPTHTFSWTPLPGDSGTFQVTFHAHAGAADTNTTVAVTVTGNSPPVLRLPGPQAFAEGTLGSFTVSATDPDGDPVTLAFGGLMPTPTQAAGFDARTGTFSWRPGYIDAGNYTATFSATDGQHAPVNGTVSIVVANTDRAPTLSVSPAGTMKSIGAGMTLDFSIHADDPDPDDTLTWTVIKVPPNATVSGSGGVRSVSFTPTPDQGSLAGTPVDFIFAVSDGHIQTSLTVTVVVLTQNRPPVFTPVAPQTVAEGHTLSFEVSASDPDGQALVYSALALPRGASFDPATRTFTFTPGCDAADNAGGRTSASFAVSDGIDRATMDVALTVTGTVLRLSPPSLSFPTTRVGSAAAPLAVTVQNGGSAAGFTVLSVSSSDPAFTASPTPGVPAPLGPGESLAVAVGFRPTDAKSYAGALTVTIDDPACPSATVALGGVGLTTGVQVSRSGAEFGPVRLGATSDAASFVVTNAGEASFTISAIGLTEATDFALTLEKPAAGAYPVTLAPGDQVVFTVVARPTLLGLIPGAVSITTDLAGGGATLLPLTVVGVAPGLAVSEESLDFGAVDIRGPGAARGLTLTNYGTTTLTVGQPLVTGPGAAPYTVIGVGPAGLSLDPGRSAALTVTYQPTSESSTSSSAAVHLTSDAPDQPSIVVPLSGHGVDRHLAVAPAALTFAATGVGESTRASLVVSNLGGAPLVFGDTVATLMGPFAVSGVPARLEPGANATATVTFTPTAAGPVNGTLTLLSDDRDHPRLEVPLVGLGTIADLVVTPSRLDVGTAWLGQEKPVDGLVLENRAATTTHAITRLCMAAEDGVACAAGSSPFRVAQTTPVSVGPKGKLALRVLFAPTALGAAAARLLVFADDQAEPTASVDLTGSGVDDLHVRGGGCAVGGGPGPGGAGWATLALVFLLARGRGRGRRQALLALVLAAPVAARADAAFELSLHRPATVPDSSLLVGERPEVLPAGALGLALHVDYAKNPLYALRDGAMSSDTPVANRAAGTLLAAYGLAGRLELAVSLPLIVENGDAGASGVTAGSGLAVGDVGLGARLAVVPHLAALALGISLPTGDADRYAGAGVPSGTLLFVLGGTLGPVGLAARLGVRLRGEAHLGQDTQGRALPFGAGAAVRVAGPLELLAEVYGAVNITSDNGGPSPIEAVAGARVTRGALRVTAGGGAGVVNGVGAADLRLFASVGYTFGASASAGEAAPSEAEAQAAPSAAVPSAASSADPDRDGDGIPDRLDRCPDEPEDKDGFQDQDGCDDPDNDHDGIPDVVDQCPNEPETVNGVEDDDGCPDKGEPGVLLLPDRIELLVPLAWNGAVLRPASVALLGQVAATLRAHPEIARITVAVHTERSHPARDLELARKRADAVRAALVLRGVPATRIATDPIGSAQPLRKGLSERIEILLR